MNRDIDEEQLNLDWLRSYTDLVVTTLRTESFDEARAVEFLERVKGAILDRFPEKEMEYRLIYDRRFKRILMRQGIVLPLY